MEDSPNEGSSADSPSGGDSDPAGSTSRSATRAVSGRGTPGPSGPLERRADPQWWAVDAGPGTPAAGPVPNPPIRPSGAATGRWRNIALGLGLVLAILLGATGQLVYSALNSGSGSADGTASPPVSVASASPTPAGSATATPGITATPAPTSSAGATSTATDTFTPAPLVGGTSAPATITFRDLMIDSAADAGGTARTFAFTTDGPGSVSAQVVGAAPLTNLKLCLQVNGGQQSCVTGATPGFFTRAPSAGDQSQWIVTIVATDPGATSVADVAFTWGTKAPAITLSHGRFQGTPNPDSVRGFTATFKTRAAGSVGVVATWPPAVTNAALTLTDVTATPGSAVGQATYQAAGAISPTYSKAVSAGRTYQLQVLNSGPDNGRPDLTTTITFP